MLLFSKRLNICRFSPLRTAPRGSVEAEIAEDADPGPGQLLRIPRGVAKLSMVVSDHSARILECINYHTY